jgi:putative DNA methylase
MAEDTRYKKKLIEVALPLDAINVASAREKSIRHGHPSTLHLWWARRPLAACRAVLFAQLVDDPSAHPDEFPTEEAQDAERQRLFGIIERLVQWENSTNEEVLEEARAEIRRSCDGNPPPILDPFAGGGSIPLEAQRLGLEAHASDLNPVAVLINKALIEIPPKWADQAPVHPEAEKRLRWRGAEGLAEDVRRYGKWMRDEAEKRIGHLYPKAALPDGRKADVVAWIWARAVTCPNPACRATLPLVRSCWLSKRKGKEAWIQVKPDAGTMATRYKVVNGGSPALERTTERAGAVCPACKELARFEYVRVEAQQHRMFNELLAVVANGKRQRIYVGPTEDHLAAAEVIRPPIATTPLIGKATVNVSLYGHTEVGDLFSPRQLTALNTFSELLSDAAVMAGREAIEAGLEQAAGKEYAQSVKLYLAFAISKLADRHSMLTNWYVSRESTSSTFQRQALAMLWDFAETNPLLDGTGTYANAVHWVAEVIDKTIVSPSGIAVQANATDARAEKFVVCTDPPYYDNISYADLSDYFYAFLRESLVNDFPHLLSTVATPKQEEMVASAHRHGGSKEKAAQFFEGEFVRTFTTIRSSHPPEYPLSLFYAFKQAENDVANEALSSTGWATMLEGLSKAGLMVTATWPMRTEAENRMVGRGSNALASSIVLACRPRPESAGVTDRQGLTRALQHELPGPLHELQKAHIAPVDLRQAAIGPGMAVFSRFARVIEPDGSNMRVRTALGLINQVLDQVLGEQESEFDAGTRWAIHWFSQFFGDEGPYGVAEQLAVSMNVAVSKMVASGIIASGGGKVRLLGRDELPDDWDPTQDLRTSVWEATQHLVKRLETEGEAATARLLRKLGSLGDPARLLSYRLYTVCEKARPGLAAPYNALVASWPEIQRLARDVSEPVATAEQKTFDA